MEPRSTGGRHDEDDGDDNDDDALDAADDSDDDEEDGEDDGARMQTVFSAVSPQARLSVRPHCQLSVSVLHVLLKSRRIVCVGSSFLVLLCYDFLCFVMLGFAS